MIHEENLADYDEQIEKFTEDKLGDIEIVFANGLSEVLNNCDPKGKYTTYILNIINHNKDRIDFVVGSTLSISIAYLFLFIFSPLFFVNVASRNSRLLKIPDCYKQSIMIDIFMCFNDDTP